ncbi:MAG: hypothetical protein U0835_11700 [Isosphaeraceae bacterium]
MTTPRSIARTRRLAALIVLALAGTVTLTGCDPRTLIYFLQPYEPTIPAPGPSLKGKRVVLVTHAVAGAQGEFQSLDRELTREVATLLRNKVKKIDLVEPDKVWTWVEGHPNWTDPAELAKAFDADVVVFLEVESFQLQHPSDLNVYQGSARTHISVTEMQYPTNTKGKPIKDKPREPKNIYDDYRDTEFPVRGPIPFDSGVSRSAFKNRLLKVTAAEISWHFVEHSPEDDIQDVKFNGR